MKKPFVYINSAMSVDGKLSTIERRQVRISNQADLERVDLLRAESDAVMVGSRTVIIDDPKLVVKSEELRRRRKEKGLTENPMKVMVGSVRDLSLDSDFLGYGKAEKIIFTTEKDDPQKVMELSGSARVVVLGEKRVDLEKMLEVLYDLGVRRLMIEGGGTLNYEMLEAGLVDEVYVAVGPMVFGGKAAPTFADGEGLSYERAVKMDLMGMENLSGVAVLKYRVIR